MPGRSRRLPCCSLTCAVSHRLAEPKLPYDVVFFLNRYFETIGSAIQNAGGIANQFTGDGVMALFGVGQGLRKGADAPCWRPVP